MRETLQMAYVDFVNNYLTVEKYAEYNGLTYSQALQFINIAREVYNSDHPEA